MNIETRVYKRNEIILHSAKAYDNPFMDVEINAIFTHESGTVITLPGFWNGGNEWKVRFSAELAGKWEYAVSCTDHDNTSLFDNGTIDAAPCLEPKNELEKHGYVRLEKGKRHMVYADGTPFFYLGDTHWMMPDYERLHECNYPGCSCGNQFKHIADDRIKKGFTVYQTYFSGARYQTAASGTEGWWVDNTYSVINPKPFNEVMDVMMDYLADNGITIALGFGTHASTVGAYKGNVTAMKAFARYCVARYACYPLIWITAQEITNYTHNAFACWKQVGALVGELDGYHRPNGAHQHVHAADEQRSIELDQEPWHQWWTVQGGHGGYNHLKHRSFYRSYYDHPKKKVFIETENQYEDIYCSGFCGHDAPRMGAWHAVQSGSAGFTYGVTGIWVAGWHQKYCPALLSYSPDSWFSGMDKLGSEQVGFMKKFYEYVGWYELEPSFDCRYGKFEDRAHVSISHKDQDIFVYYFYTEYHGGELTHLKQNVKYQARWFDPITGVFIDAEDIITEDGSATLPYPPSPRDWVLLLNCVDLGPYKKSEYPVKYAPIAVADAQPGEEIKIRSIRAISEDEEHPITNVLDDTDSFYQGFAFKTSQCIFLDLGEKQDIGYLYMKTPMENMRYIQYHLCGSNDGEHYDLITERLSADIAMGGPYPEYYETVKASYRYLRIFFNAQDHPTVTTPFPITQIKVFK